MTALINPVPERFSPAQLGLKAYSCDPRLSTTNLNCVSGDLIGVMIPVTVPIYVTTLWLKVTTAAVAPTISLAGVADINGNLLASIPDQSGVWIANGVYSALLNIPLLLQPPYVWGEILSVATTTPASFTSGGNATSANFGPGIPEPAQRIAAGANALASFNPNSSLITRNNAMIGLS